jgi:Leucine-rich repeat (LRR) protein
VHRPKASPLPQAPAPPLDAPTLPRPCLLLPPPRGQALPHEVGRLSRLRSLRVRNNRLGALPPALGGCSGLVELHAGFNSIASLPDSLGAVRGLAVLEMRNNHLTVGGGAVQGGALRAWSDADTALECFGAAAAARALLRAR